MLVLKQQNSWKRRGLKALQCFPIILQEQQDTALEKIGAEVGDKVKVIIIKEDWICR